MITIMKYITMKKRIVAMMMDYYPLTTYYILPFWRRYIFFRELYDEGKWIDWSGASSTYVRKTLLGQQGIAGKGLDIDSAFAVDNFSLKAYMVEASADEVTPNLTEAQTVKVPKAPKTGDSIKQIYRY